MQQAYVKQQVLNEINTSGNSDNQSDVDRDMENDIDNASNQMIESILKDEKIIRNLELTLNIAKMKNESLVEILAKSR